MSSPNVSLESVNSSVITETLHEQPKEGELRGREVLIVRNSKSTTSPTNLLQQEESSSPDQETPLAKHVRFFANSEGVVTPISLYEKLSALGLSCPRSALMSATITAGIIAKVGFNKMHANESHILNHPCDSKIFLSTGEVDQDALNKFLDRFPNDFISKLDIDKFLDEFKERDKDKNTFGIYSSASSGEFNLFLELCTDHFEKIDGEYVPCLTKDTIRQFYKDSSVLFDKVIKGELPVKKTEV